MVTEKDTIKQILIGRGILKEDGTIDKVRFQKLVTEPWINNKAKMYGFLDENKKCEEIPVAVETAVVEELVEEDNPDNPAEMAGETEPVVEEIDLEPVVEVVSNEEPVVEPAVEEPVVEETNEELSNTTTEIPAEESVEEKPKKSSKKTSKK